MPANLSHTGFRPLRNPLLTDAGLDLGADGSLLGLWYRSAGGYEARSDLELSQDDGPEEGLWRRLAEGTWALVAVEVRPVGTTSRERREWLNKYGGSHRYALQPKMPLILAALDDLVDLGDDDSGFREAAQAFASQFGLLGLQFTRFVDRLPEVCAPGAPCELLDWWREEVRQYGAFRRVQRAADQLAASKGRDQQRWLLRDALAAERSVLHSWRFGSPEPRLGLDLRWARDYLASIVDQRVSGHLRSATKPAPAGALRFMPDSLLTAVYLQLGTELAGGGRRLRRCGHCRQHFEMSRGGRLWCSANCRVAAHRAQRRAAAGG